MTSHSALRFQLLASLGLMQGCGQYEVEDVAPLPVTGTVRPVSPSASVPTAEMELPAQVATRGSDGACEPPTVPAGPGLELCNNGLLHRTEAVVCSEPSATTGPVLQPAPSGEGYVFISGGESKRVAYFECVQDADCVAFPRGHCIVNSETPSATAYCSYTCATDADCAGDVCECADGGYGQCVRSFGCRTDSDCAASEACARLTHGYACTAEFDECHMDAECGVSTPYCRACEICETHLCVPREASAGLECYHASGRQPCDGRPFVVDSVARVAPAVERADWAARGVANDFASQLPMDQRATLSEHWLRTAQLEHASIAAFARFALQLLSVGAPPRLLEATHVAMADEVRHARLAFGLASAYRSGAAGAGMLGPAGLDCSGALNDSTLGDIVVGTFLEGCIGETLAVLSARDALEHCRVDAVRRVLSVIARDEARHAELAWQFVAWALPRCPGLGRALETIVKQRLQQVLVPHPRGVESSRGEGVPRWQREQGAAEATPELEARGLAEVVLPVLQALDAAQAALGSLRENPVAAATSTIHTNPTVNTPSQLASA